VDSLQLDPDGIDRYVFPDYEPRLSEVKEPFTEDVIGNFLKEELAIRNFLETFDELVQALEAARSMQCGVLKVLPLPPFLQPTFRKGT